MLLMLETTSNLSVEGAIQVSPRRMLPNDLSEFALGRRGISLPVYGRHGGWAPLSINGDAGERDWESLEYVREFQALPLHMHQAILRLAACPPNRAASSSPREDEGLLWFAEGKTH